MCGNVLTHSATKTCVAFSEQIMAFFNTHSRLYSALKRIMLEMHGKTYDFVEGETRW